MKPPAQIEASGIARRCSEVVATHRAKHRMSKLAFARELGTEATVLYNLDNGQCPSSWMFARICRVTGADPSVLLGLTETKAGGLQS